MQHHKQPWESQDHPLVEKLLWNHGNVPSLSRETGRFYPMLGPIELSAAERYTTLWRDHRVFVPCATIQNWVEAGGKKRRKLRWAARFSSGHLRHFRAMLPSTNCMKGHTVSSLPWIIGTTNACCMRCLTTMRPIRTSKRFWDV